MSFQHFDPFHDDPPIFPVEEVGDDWHRLYDLMARNTLVNRIECPDWFRIVLTPTNGGWQARLSFLTPQLCPHCRGQTVRGGVSCMECHGAGTRRDEEYRTDTRDRIINLVVRDQIARSLPLVLADDRFAG